MPDLEDLDLHDPGTVIESVEPLSPRRSTLRFAIPAAVIVIALIGGYMLMQRREIASTTPAPSRSATIPPPTTATSPSPPPVTLPPLDQSDAFVSQMVQALSKQPSVIAWLTTKGLVRNAAVVTVAIADGAAPAAQLRPLKPAGRFMVTESRAPAIDPRSYQRYDMLTAAIASVDPAAAARAYATLKPLLDEAHRDLGYPDTPFDRTLERAVGRLLQTPVTAERVPLRVRGGLFAFDDPRLEGLSAAQKQLLRFGPRNVQRIQASLRAFATAAGLQPGGQ